MAHLALKKKDSSQRTVYRNNVRMEADLWEAIDSARSQRAGNISRNTWITEAVQEKLTREAITSEPRKIRKGKAHG